MSPEQNKKIKVRFAPSPTGYLHVGGARTALFNWLLARQSGGAFVLRIEDTDAQRSDAAMTEQILDAMRWLGLDWDEGPFFQSKRLDHYRALVDRLVEEGKAYWSDRPPSARTVKGAALENDNEEIPAGRAVWFRMPEGETKFLDGVRGEVAFQNEEIGDFVILKSDGYPTYHMAVVADDAAMGITRVIRGDDHLSNTPKQIQLFRALGHEPPVYAHVPLILGTDKKRLSKRHGATSVQQFREDGILSEALFNFLALLGWSPGEDREILSREEIVELFSVERVSKKGAVFDYEKLEWMNGQYLTAMDPAEVYGKIEDQITALGGPLMDLPQEANLRLVALLKEKVRRLGEIVPFGSYAFTEDFAVEEEAARKHWKGEDLLERLNLCRGFLAGFDPFTHTTMEEALKSLSAEKEIGFGKLIHPLRVAVTGRAVTPNIFEIIELLGRARCLDRLDRAIKRIAS